MIENSENTPVTTLYQLAVDLEFLKFFASKGSLLCAQDVWEYVLAETFIVPMSQEENVSKIEIQFLFIEILGMVKTTTSSSICKFIKLRGNNMSTTQPAVENRTFVMGQDAGTLSDADLMAHIKKLQDDIKAMNSLDIKSKTIAKKLTKVGEDIKAIVEVLDTRVEEQ